jgi:predicted 3-demethylubiquinone-9 3-methyltransferase (glyoxalase superfamily)
MKHRYRPSPVVMAHLNQLLDEALNETFPASGPIAIAVEVESTEETDFYNAVQSRSRSEACTWR